MVKIIIDTEEGIDFKGSLSYSDCTQVIKGCSLLIDNMIEHMQKQAVYAIVTSAKEGALAQGIYGDDGKIPSQNLEDAAKKGFKILYPEDEEIKKE